MKKFVYKNGKFNPAILGFIKEGRRVPIATWIYNSCGLSFKKACDVAWAIVDGAKPLFLHYEYYE